MSAIPKLVDCGIKLFVAIIKNLPRIIVEICKAVPQIVSSLIEAFGRLMSKFTEVGGDIVEGLWNGIKSGWDWLVDKVSGIAGGLVDAAKGALGIHSPSTKFKWLGEMCVAGFDEGAEDLLNPDGFTKNINASLRTVSANTSMSSRLGTDSITDAVADALMSVFEATSSQAPVGEQVTQVYLYPGAAEFGAVVYGAQSDASRRGLIPRIV
jgi:phage-related protein